MLGQLLEVELPQGVPDAFSFLMRELVDLLFILPACNLFCEF
jgi:hypothetical protein